MRKGSDTSSKEVGKNSQEQFRATQSSALSSRVASHRENAYHQFWSQAGADLVEWSKPWDQTFNEDRATWFSGAELNVCYNCLDRHVYSGRRNMAALIWQGENEEDVQVFTFHTLHKEVNRFASVLIRYGVTRGDRVTLFLPMIPELVIAMLACARIGAVHCAVFAGFSAATLASRVRKSGSKVVVTADGLMRGGRSSDLKNVVDQAMDSLPDIATCIVVQRAGLVVEMKPGRDIWYHDAMIANGTDNEVAPVPIEASMPLFELYTSGVTAHPKRVVHSAGGYFVYALHSAQEVFRFDEKDIHWCTADLGWITGHTYLLYGPLGLGVTTLMFEGVPTYPGPDRYWRVVEKFGVSVFYTSPTALKLLMRYGTEPVHIHDLKTLRFLGSFGETVREQEKHWYAGVVGGGRLSVCDTWLQTESGGIVAYTDLQANTGNPQLGMKPVAGVDVAVVDEQGGNAGIGSNGRLTLPSPWPGASDLVAKTFMTGSAKVYDTGDGACWQDEHHLTIVGRTDDSTNLTGELNLVVELESALGSHPAVAEVAAVSVTGEEEQDGIYVFAVLKDRRLPVATLTADLRRHLERSLSSTSTPVMICCVPQLPKTRSGKILRRLLRLIVAGKQEDLGDLSVLADSTVIASLIQPLRDEGYLQVDDG